MAGCAHAIRPQTYPQRDIESTMASMMVVREPAGDLRRFRPPLKRGHTEGCQCVECDDPGRDTCQEALPKKRTERLALPSLDIAGGPIVYQTKADDGFLGFAKSKRLAERVSLPDVKTDLQFEIKLFRRRVVSSYMFITICCQGFGRLPVRSDALRTAHGN